MYPFQMHSIALSTFASLIGPFGGFFASGFKRAFKIKVCNDSCKPILFGFLFELDKLVGLFGFFNHSL